MRRALVLGGGGARGAYQVGMLDVLVRQKRLDFSILRGTSVGALNASVIAQARTSADAAASTANLDQAVAALLHIWTTEIQGNRSIFTERATGFAGLAAGADSLFDNAPLKKLLKKHVDPAKLAASGRDFAVGTVSLVRGGFHTWHVASPNYLDLILASTAIPVVFPPVWREEAGEEKDVLVDGGVREITPLSSAFRAAPGPEEIYVLLTSRAERRPDGRLPSNCAQVTEYSDWNDNWLGTKVTGLDVLKRTVDLLTDEVYLDDIRGALEWNTVLQSAGALIAAAKAVGGQPALAATVTALEKSIQATKKHPVAIHVLAPREWYGKDNSATAFAPELIAKAIQHGRDVASDPGLWLWP